MHDNMGTGSVPTVSADCDSPPGTSKKQPKDSTSRPTPPVSTPAMATSPKSSTILHRIVPTSDAVLTPESLIDNDDNPVVGAGGAPVEGAAVTASTTGTTDSSASGSQGARVAHCSALHIIMPQQSEVLEQTSSQPPSPSRRPAIQCQSPRQSSFAAKTVANLQNPEVSRGTSLSQPHAGTDRPPLVSRGHDSPGPDTDKPQPPWSAPQRQPPGNSTSTSAAGDDATPNNTRSPSTPGRSHHNHDGATADPLSPLTVDFLPPPLRTSVALAETKIVHPRPIALPASGSTTPTSATNSRSYYTFHSRDQSISSFAFVDNVAQLEATAERLSTGTSSIGDAIRELHGELKRSDSRRSSILAPSTRAHTDDASADPNLAHDTKYDQLKRHLSNSSSIVATNAAARYGGYSPGGFIMSPSHSLTGRLRSGSKNSSGRPDLDHDDIMTRRGPGKSSVRSVRSAKMSLAEISESDPTSLGKDALDAADAAPPVENDDTRDHDASGLQIDEDAGSDPGVGAFRQMLDDSFKQDALQGQPSYRQGVGEDEIGRPSSAQSGNTFQQAQEAFIDFDGVHWQPDLELDQDQPGYGPPIPMIPESEFPTTYYPPPDMVRPQSYMDPETGQQMLYYPARVPAMLNLPPKLSNKQRAEQRNNRRSKVLSVMVDSNRKSEAFESKRRSGMPDTSRESWLPDPLAGHRDSFNALSHEPWSGEEGRNSSTLPGTQPEPESTADSPPLRRPQRLSRNNSEDPKPRAARMSHLPPQLRASAFFDMPSTAPELEVKHGSAMDTLESMLDASTNAPVTAFASHGLGPVKDKKHRPKPSTSSAGQESVGREPKKRTSRLWFKRSTSYNSGDQGEAKQSRSPSALGDVNQKTDAGETQALSSAIDDASVRRLEVDDDGGSVKSDTDSDEDADGDGQPTTLLAELQLRKKQQKQRTAPRVQAAHMTLLEMDAVAETQRKSRQNKRVNLAWEDPDAHLDQNGSDDEDVPLAVIAAKHNGAKNMADLERPIGLMERRDMEDNEPLSHRRARLQGHQPMSLGLPKRQSIATLSAHLSGHARSPSAIAQSPAATPEPEEPEIEQETLGERKRRLEAKELPKARPVSSSFSAELLSHFGDVEEATNKLADEGDKENRRSALPVAEEEETLGQRRRRLQVEAKAREREMSYGNLVGDREEAPPAVSRRLSMADMLAAHPRRDSGNPALQERQRMEQERTAARNRESKMAAVRMQMPTHLAASGVDRAGGFRGGVYNDGRGGLVNQATVSTTALNNSQGLGVLPKHNRSTTAVSAYGMPVAQAGYRASPGFGPYAGNNAGLYGHMNATPYARNSMHMPWQAEVRPQMSPSINRVEQWRHGVMP